MVTKPGRAVRCRRMALLTALAVEMAPSFRECMAGVVEAVTTFFLPGLFCKASDSRGPQSASFEEEEGRYI